MSKDQERKNLEKLHKKIQKSEKEEDKSSSEKDKSLIEDIQVQYKRDVGDEVSEVDEKTEQSEVISAKKVIYIEIDDEVTTVYDKIRNLKIKHIYLVVPQRAVLFQSIVNLKILKRKATEDGKALYIITNDKNGTYLSERVGIPVYDKVSTEGKPMLFSSSEEDEKLRITPLKATVNSVIDDAPTRRTERKLSISEILSMKKNKKNPLGVNRLGEDKAGLFSLSGGLSSFGGGFGAKKDSREQALADSEAKAKKEEKIRKHRLVLVAPNRQALIGLGAVSLLILMVIFYVALPGVTVYLTPAVSVLEKSVNVTFAEYDKNKAEIEAGTPHMIASYKITTNVERTVSHSATGKELSPNAASASGNITIVNTAGYQWPLVAKTRFQTNEGLVFRIPQEILVPAATNNGPGKIDAYVVADSVDAFGQIIGERGNIGPTKFFLPGLKDSSRSLLYADSFSDMKGGVTDYTTFVSDDDIEASKIKLSGILHKAVNDELAKEVENKNNVDSTDCVLLVGDDAVWTSEVTINPVSTVAGQDIPQFEVSGSLTASGYCYSKSEMTNLLTQELLLKKSPQKKLIQVNENTVTYRIYDKDLVKNKIKVTASVKGIEEFDIDPKKENGARLINKIKEHILGRNIEDAKNYIQNLPEINKVEIKSWPAWSPTVPTVPDNIKIEIMNL